MKKKYFAAAALALALGVTACSSKKADEAANTAAQTTEASSEETAEEMTEEALEEDYFYGLVSAVEDKIITVADQDGLEAKFDISEAELTGAEEIGEEDEVEVTFEGERSEDVTKAVHVDVIVSAAEAAAEAEAENADETISGTIEKADDKSLTLAAEDGTYTFNAIIAQKVTKDGIKEGAEADITFYGDLEDTTDLPVATKIVTADAADTEDAKIMTLTGKAAEVGEDHLVLDTADPDNTLFTFAGESGMFDGIQSGDTVTVIYEGTLTDRTIQAVGIK